MVVARCVGFCVVGCGVLIGVGGEEGEERRERGWVEGKMCVQYPSQGVGSEGEGGMCW